MKIGIFSKIGANGGSEHRCAEMCNSIVRHSPHEAILLCEKDLNDVIEKKLDDKVVVHKNVLKGDAKNVERLYEVDTLLVVNSDSYSFSKLDYWRGRCPEHHEIKVDLKKIKQMVFLYNFVISPASHLWTIQQEIDDVRVICANKEFFNAITDSKNKYAKIKHLPRIILDSPIDPGSITTEKTDSDRIRIGKHSKAHGYKFNEEHPELIKRINKRYGDRVAWDFLGVPSDRAEEIKGIKNVTVRREYTIPVGEYLKGIDIFLFFISWGRNEPWSRAVAEGMMAGCPVLATNKAGNKDQILHENNGYLCDSVDEFEDWISYLIENPDRIRQLGRNGHIYSMQFTSEKIIQKYLDFIQA